MNLSGYKANPHPTFWKDDRPLRTMAQTRNWAGDFFESATANLLNARRHKTDSTADACPDLSVSVTDFLESKSSGASGSVLVYDARLEKDQRWTLEHGASLTYAIWRHRTACTGFKWRSELWADLGRTVYECLLYPLDLLGADCTPDKIRKLNSGGKTNGAAWGYGSDGYKRGWCIPVNRLRARCNVGLMIPGVLSNGVQTVSFGIWCAGGTERLLKIGGGG